MVFSSLPFLCVFLPAVFLAALLVRRTSIQNGLLTVASLLFYAYGEPAFLLLMVLMSLGAYGFGLAIGRTARPQARKMACAVAVVGALGALGLFKYAGWLVGVVGQAFDVAMTVEALALPVGISFYTFQAISYVVDVYRGDVVPQRNVMRLVLYISFFPQLIAGPIIRYHDVEAQLAHRRITLEGAVVGMRRFAVGLAKKVLVADVLAVAVDAIFGAEPGAVGGAAAWVAALAYVLQIYFDFSGYSDMAIGMARMFGFTYKENFDYPYVSSSIQEFWRRWHLSLSTWFKEYLYIPLGGNRRGRARTVANKMLVFLCCGLWHGAAWTFVAWGLIQGLFLLLEEYVPALRRLPRPVGWLYAMAVTTLSFVVFRADGMGQALLFLQQMALGWGPLSAQGQVLLAAQLTPLFLWTFAVGVVGAAPVVPWLRERLLAAGEPVQRAAEAASSVACLGLLALCLVTLAGGAYSPFIYFRF